MTTWTMQTGILLLGSAAFVACMSPAGEDHTGCVPAAEFDGPPYFVYLEGVTKDGLWGGVDINTCYALPPEDESWSASTLYDVAPGGLPLDEELAGARPATLPEFLAVECPNAGMDNPSDCIHAMARYRDARTGDEFVSVQLTTGMPTFPERPGDLFYKLDAEAGHPLVAIQQNVSGVYEVCPDSHSLFLEACEPEQERHIWWLWTGSDPADWEIVEWIHDEETYQNDSGGSWQRHYTASQ